MTTKLRPTPAFNGKIASKINDAIRAMEAHEHALAFQAFTPSDLMRLFVDPEHHHTLMTAYQLCEPSGQTQELYVHCEVPREYGGGVAHIRFHWHGLDTPHAFYVPHRSGASHGLPARVRDDAPGDLRERFEQVSSDMIASSANFSQVQRVFSRLNKVGVCDTPAQMRYHWPCITALLRRSSGSYASMADNIETASVRAGDMARIPRDLVPSIGVTNSIVARHLMLVDMPKPEKTGVQYELRESFKRH